MKVQFSNEVIFNDAKFFAKADFEDAQFSAKASFIGVEFYKFADFDSAEFLAKANFQAARFSTYAKFWKAHFSDVTNFSLVQFSGVADFGEAKFKDASIFVACLYGRPTNFRDVIGFSNMQMEWTYDPGKFYFTKEKNEKKAKRRGLKGHLEYSETFYIALIKNYREIGWLQEADDCYHTYRVEKRKERSLCAGILEWQFLEATFGYGVKPWILLRTFLIFWIPFSI